ncbi:MAG: C-GCAxxG-C-C family protein [Streptococcaceae bacterium]|nr:C-GCAxxG-C-C family protein [Streptococcaceae bacterium]
MKKEINLKELRKDAEEGYRRGDFFCSESIVATIRNHFDMDIPLEAVAMASGFPVGVGRAKCMCGAISGGVMSLGYFFGRQEGGDPKVQKMMELSNELHTAFRAKNRVACCSILTSKMDMASREHIDQCVRFTGEMAEETAKIIVRELPEQYVFVEEKESVLN